MSDPFNEQLDAELDALLQRTDGNEQEMQDLLEIAVVLRAQYEYPIPSAEGAERGKARLLAAVVERRRQKTSPARPTMRERFNGWLLGNPGQRLALAGALSIILLLIGNGVVSLSAESLPGDPLYSVKRAQESVRYSLEQDEARREQLRDEFDDARAREVQAVRRQLRTARIELTGHLESIDGQTIEIGGFVLVVPLQIADTSRLQVGDRLVVTVETRGDGTITVVALELPVQLVPVPEPIPGEATGTATQPATPLPTATPRPPTATPAPRPTDTIPAPTATAPPALTATPARSPETVETPRQQAPSPDPTETRAATPPGPTETRRPTSTPEPTDTPKPSSTVQSGQTKEPTRTAEPTRTESPTETPRPSTTAESRETPRPSRTP